MVKRPGRDVDHSPPSGAEAKNEWSYTSTPRICHHGMDRDNFTSVFTNTNTNQVCLNTIQNHSSQFLAGI